MKNLLKICFRVILFLIFFSSCDEDLKTNIPYAPVNFLINLEYADNVLNNPYHFETFSYSKYPNGRNDGEHVGYGGILIYHGMETDSNPNGLYAYDLSCQVEADRNVLVVADEEGTATCPKCGAKYSVHTGGAPLNTAKFWLHPYRIVSVSGAGNRYKIIN